MALYLVLRGRPIDLETRIVLGQRTPARQGGAVMQRSEPPYRAHKSEPPEEFYSHAGQAMVTGSDLRCVILIPERYGMGTAIVDVNAADIQLANWQAEVIADVFNGMTGHFQPDAVR